MKLRRLAHTRVIRYTTIAVLAFTLGSATVVLAASSGAMQLPAFRLADGTNPEQFAKVDAAGNVHVSVNNLPGTQQISGTVDVSNFPTTQQVSGTVSVTAPSGRVILLGTNVPAPTGNSNTPVAGVDTSDCRSLVGMARHAGVASDVAIRLVLENPDGSGFGPVNGTLAGIHYYFTVGGTPIVSPRASLSVQSTTDDPIVVQSLWLFCHR
jgi:hypothetical protein